MNENSAHVLIVDDDENIRNALERYLGQHGHSVSVAGDAGQMDAALAREPIDVIVLDVMLPGEDGLSICRRLADSDVPILVLSALGDATDRIIGLELGAADYLAKPFEPRELLARIRVLLRRKPVSRDRPGGSIIRFAGWTMDVQEKQLWSPGGTPVTLSGSEFAMLAALVQRPRRLLSRDQLMDLTRGATADNFDRVIDLTISRLRRRLGVHPNGGSLIETVRGEGYRFTAEVRFQ